MTKLLTWIRGQAIAILALFLALSGGYAIAATTSSKTITVCANKKTGVLYLHNHGRCTRKQTRISWNQQGPQGPTGPHRARRRVSSQRLGERDRDRQAPFRSRVVGPARVRRHVPGDGDRGRAARRGSTLRRSRSLTPIRRCGQSAGAFPEAWVGHWWRQRAVHGCHRRGCQWLVHGHGSQLQRARRLLVTRAREKGRLMLGKRPVAVVATLAAPLWSWPVRARLWRGRSRSTWIRRRGRAVIC